MGEGVGRTGQYASTSVVIAARNSAGTLQATLDSLVAQDCSGFEVVVADNGSNDATGEIARGYGDRLRIRVIDTGERIGIGFARRAGVEAAAGEQLVFVDSDDTVNRSYVRALTDALVAHDAAHAAQDDTKHNAASLLLRRRAPGASKVMVGDWHLVYGGCLAIRRSAYDAVGGWPVERNVSEDADLSWRLHLAGHQVVVVPEAVLHVRFRSTAGAAFAQGRNYGRFQARSNRMWRPHGLPVESEWTLASRLTQLAGELPSLRGREHRTGWAFEAGLVVQRIATNVVDVAIRRRLRDPLAIERPSTDPTLARYRALRPDLFERAIVAAGLTPDVGAAAPSLSSEALRPRS